MAASHMCMPRESVTSSKPRYFTWNEQLPDLTRFSSSSQRAGRVDAAAAAAAAGAVVVVFEDEVTLSTFDELAGVLDPAVAAAAVVAGVVFEASSADCVTSAVVVDLLGCLLCDFFL